MENEQVRCKSQFCVVNSEGIRGRLFTPPEGVSGLPKVWCPQCVIIGKQITFFSAQTADMIRAIYQEYDATPLPKEVKLVLQQFAREIVQQLGEEL